MLSQKPQFTKVSDFTWEIPASFKQGMRVPARIYATRKLLDAMDLQVYDQVTNVATLPGIVNHALCMPDGHIDAFQLSNKANPGTDSQSEALPHSTPRTTE